MSNNEKYNNLSDGEVSVPSNMGIIPAKMNFEFFEDNIRESLQNSKDFTLLSFSQIQNNTPAFDLNIEYKEKTYSAALYVYPTKSIGLADFGFANQVEKSDFDLAMLQPYYLEVSVFFGSDPMESFHLQLKIMHSVVPEASLVVDFMSFRLLSAKWLKMTAESHIPPSPDYLYTLHAVYNEDGDNTSYWFHTHGLYRCGLVELEIINVKQGAQQMNDLITMVVKKFIKDPTPENHKFQIGYDGLGIHLQWLRWEDAVTDFPDSVLGGRNDRLGEDNVHTGPSGVLFAVEDNNLMSPEIYVTTLADNPIFYISNEETYRMSELAKERFNFYKDVFRKHHKPKERTSFWRRIFAKKQEEVPSWRFIAKLGLNVDADKAETEKEHLWFEVLSIENENITAKLLNQPYWISTLNQGDVRTYPVALLTDWIIYSPEGYQYTTDSIYQLGYS